MIQTANGSRGETASNGVIRAVAYTRQSVDRSSDQEFGSIQAQREAIASYVKSQRAQGWCLSPECYDDGGFSGATTRRPAFEQLMRDVEARKVDVVAVYKIDRLSRSLLDFADIMRTFKQRGVDFVSTTQRFDTSNPMGKLMLHILMSFSEFERETIAERTRDKIVAMRKQGLWGPGRPPMGYRRKNRELVVQKNEAALVRHIFELHLRCGSLGAVARELDRRGSRRRSGKPWTPREVRRVLTSVALTGRVPCKNQAFDGKHKAIIDNETFEAAQAKLRTNGCNGSTTTRNKHGLLLRGLIHCRCCGRRMVSHYSKRGSVLYHVYTCRSPSRSGSSQCPGQRVKAREFEAFVIDKIREIGRDPTILTKTIDAAREDALRKKPELQDEARHVQGEIQRLSNQRDNLIDAIAEAGSGASALGQRLGEIDEQITQLEMRRGEVQAELAAIEHTRIDEDEVREALAQFDPIWDQLDTSEKTRVLHLLIERIEIDSEAGRVDITYRPGGIQALQGSE